MGRYCIDCVSILEKEGKEKGKCSFLNTEDDVFYGKHQDKKSYL